MLDQLGLQLEVQALPIQGPVVVAAVSMGNLKDTRDPEAAAVDLLKLSFRVHLLLMLMVLERAAREARLVRAALRVGPEELDILKLQNFINK